MEFKSCFFHLACSKQLRINRNIMEFKSYLKDHLVELVSPELIET